MIGCRCITDCNNCNGCNKCYNCKDCNLCTECENCNKEGYKGRLGLYEVMQITKEIKKLIAIGAHDIQIEEAAVGSGMRTLQQACLHHIISGSTTISEFVRVLGPVND